MVTAAVVTVAVVGYVGYRAYEESKSNAKVEVSSKTKYLPDVKAKSQSYKVYQLAYVNNQGELKRIGKKLTFEEALLALGITGATNSITQRFTYDKGRSSPAQRTLEEYSGVYGIYASGQRPAKALAVVLGWSGPPEVHASGMYGHYHDSTHTFHIWYGGKLLY